MFYENDWLMRQIDIIVEVLARLIFHKDIVMYEYESKTSKTDTDQLYEKMEELCAQGKICEAEDLLFENANPGSNKYLELAIDFYRRLEKMSDEELEKHNFSRQEIYDGLKEIVSRQKGLPPLPLFDDPQP